MIEQVIGEFGLAAIAGKCRVSPQAVFKWQRDGVPAERVLDFCRAIDWRLSPHKVRPDIYPNVHDGLPAERRRETA